MSLTDRLAVFFNAHPLEWIDGRELAHVGGVYAWRTRTAEIRRPPFNMNIVNRQRRVRVDDHLITISEYRYLPLDVSRSAECAEVRSEGRTL